MERMTFDIHCNRLKRYLIVTQGESFKDIFCANVKVVHQQVITQFAETKWSNKFSLGL